MVVGRFSSSPSLTAAAATLPQELDMLRVDMVAVAGLPALG